MLTGPDAQLPSEGPSGIKSSGTWRRRVGIDLDLARLLQQKPGGSMDWNSPRTAANADNEGLSFWLRGLMESRLVIDLALRSPQAIRSGGATFVENTSHDPVAESWTTMACC